MKTKRAKIMKNLPAVAVALAAIFSAAIAAPAQTDQRVRASRPADTRSLEKISKWPPREKRFAIIIGVDEYTDSKITPLIAPSEDAHMLYDALIEYADFPRENITLLTNDRSSLNQPTRPIILEYLSNLRKLLPPDGLLLVAFSGHGIEVEGQAFLLGADARLNDDLKVLRDTAIGWTDMMEYIADSGVGQVVMLLDACRNDPRSGKSAPRPNRITQLYSRGVGLKTYKSKITGYAKLLATSMGEQAWEDAEKRQGFFMGAIVDGLKGAAANEDGKVTLASLIKYTKNEVTQRARRRGLTQAPSEEILNYDTDQIVIAEFETKTKTAVSTPARNEELPAYMPDFELAFWQSVEKRDEPAEYELYLKRYPNGVYAELAKSRIARLRKTQAAAPPVTAPAEIKPSAPVKSDAAPKAEDVMQAELKRQQSARQTEQQQQAQLEQAEQAHWRSIINSADAAAFNEYLRLYPKGKFAAEAAARLSAIQETAYWQSIAQSKSADPFKEYLQRYPAGKFNKEARARIDEADEASHWATVNGSSDIGQLKAFLQKYPGGKHTASATAQIADLTEVSVWSTASASGTPDMLRSYLQKYPNGKFARQATLRLGEVEETVYWNAISNSTDIETFRAYLRKYPSGRFAASANNRIIDMTEAAHWNAVNNSNDPESIKAYLAAYPTGTYVDQAKAKLEGLDSIRKAAVSVESYSKKGKEFADAKRWAEASAEYRRAVEMEPNNAVLRDSLATTLISLNKWQEAEKELGEAVRLRPDISEWRGRLGFILLQQEKWQQAEAQTREAVRLDPAKAVWRNNLGWVLQFQNRWAEAEVEYRRAVDLDANNPLFRINLGWALANQKKWPEAEAELKVVIRLRPNIPEQRGRLGYILLQQQKWTEAEAETREALKLEPNKAIWHTYLAAALLNQQKWNDAEAEYKQAARLEPEKATWRGLLAGVLFQQQKWAEAEAEYNRAAQLDPNNPLYAERLKQARDYQQKSAQASTAQAAPAQPVSSAVKTVPGAEDLTPPIPLNRPRARYTKEARDEEVEGTVSLRVLVRADGTVRGVKVVKGLSHGLTEQAVIAANKMRFKPASKGGQPVEQWLAMDIEFKLK